MYIEQELNTGLDLKCPKCGRTLASKEKLIEHQKTHMSVNEQKRVAQADLTKLST